MTPGSGRPDLFLLLYPFGLRFSAACLASSTAIVEGTKDQRAGLSCRGAVEKGRAIRTTF
jgi:hypothetical protein